MGRFVLSRGASCCISSPTPLHTVSDVKLHILTQIETVSVVYLVLVIMATMYEVADLAVIKYRNLLLEDPTERSSLLEACSRWGFFYLDLSDVERGQEHLIAVKDVLDFSKEYFARPLDKKLCDTSQDFATFNICG